MLLLLQFINRLRYLLLSLFILLTTLQTAALTTPQTAQQLEDNTLQSTHQQHKNWQNG